MLLVLRHLTGVGLAAGLWLATMVGFGHAAPPTYGTFGDSFSAGAGIRPPASGSPAACSRSALNWAHDIARARDYQLTDASCNGAQSKDLGGSQAAGVPPRLNALTASTGLVTLTVAGNDSNTFGSAIQACAGAAAKTGGQGNPCATTYGSTLAKTINSVTYPALVKAFSDVRTKAPRALVGVSSYLPILHASQGCYPTMPVAVGDVPYVNGIEATLNDAVRRAASAVGFSFVDQPMAAAGYDACQSPGTRWVEPVYGAVNAMPTHPNSTGEQAMADRAVAVLGLR